MKKRILIGMLLLGGVFSARAENVVRDFAARASEASVSFRYTFHVQNQVNLQGSGSAQVQGEAFHVSGNGLDIWCDGRTRWTVDAAARELIIEPVEQDILDYAANPALLVGSVAEAFNIESVGQTKFQGKVCTAGVLSPKQKMDITWLKLYFQKDVLIGAEVRVPDGTVTEFSITDLSFKEKGPASAFAFDPAGVDASWVVTDLR